MEEQLKKLRKRGSYKRWKEWTDFLKSSPSIEEILIQIHDDLDGRQAYKSATNAEFSLTSLRQALLDTGELRRLRTEV